MSRKVTTSRHRHFTRNQPPKPGRSMFIHACVCVIALLALVVVNLQISFNARTNSNAITMKILWCDRRRFEI